MRELNLETSKILDRELNNQVEEISLESLFTRADAIGSDYEYELDDQEPTLEELFDWADIIFSAAIYQ